MNQHHYNIVPECDADHPCDHGSCWLKWGTSGYCK